MGAAELGQNAIQFSDLMRLGCLIRIEMSPVDLEYFLSAKRPTSDAVLVPGNTGASLGHPTRRFCGILTRRERWGLSGRGWLVLTLLACAGILAVLHGIYPFLAVTRTVEAPVLVVEGWIIEPAIRVGAEHFKRGSYQRIFATGGTISRSANYPVGSETYAHRGAGILYKSGIAEKSVQMVPSGSSDRDRTYSSAVALRNWFRLHEPGVRAINIVTEGAHARRTRLLFEMALGGEVSVGVISVPSPDYDARHWWRFSEGVREVVGESVAYLYARIFFFPNGQD